MELELLNDLRESVEALVGRPDGRALGNLLRAHRRRIFDGRFFDKARTSGGVAKWAVFPAKAFADGDKKTPKTPETPCDVPGGRGFRGFRGSVHPQTKLSTRNGEVHA
jgi:hypothetical protein